MRRTFPMAVGAFATAVLLATGGLAACSKDSGSTKEFCAEVKQVPSLESVLARFSEADPDALTDRIAKARAAYGELADAAPPDIAGETDKVVELVDAILDAVEQHPTDPAKASQQLRKAMADHKGVEADRTKVAAFAQKRCDVQLDSTLTKNDATTSTTAGGSNTNATSTTVPGTTTESTGTAGG